MRIALIAPFEETVPPLKYGGTELIVYNIAEQMVKKGHEVLLFASGNSKTSGKLIPIYDSAIRRMPEAKDMKVREALKYEGVGRLLKKLENEKPDIIHNHLGWRLYSFSHFLKAPMLTTLHGPLDVYCQKIIHERFKDLNYVTISLNQRKAVALNYIGNVYNGIEIDKFEYSDTPKGYYAFLGRMSPEKGPIEAIKAAEKADVNLKMAAKIDSVDTDYFKDKVEPLIKGKIEFVGEIGPDEKSDFLKNAKALIAPIQWEEPFGLYFTEAMACGTPVIAFDRGSVSEIVTEDTGFKIKPNNIEGMAKAIQEIEKMPEDEYKKMRKNCRKRVEENFTAEKMADEYEKLYKGLISK